MALKLTTLYGHWVLEPEGPLRSVTETVVVVVVVVIVVVVVVVVMMVDVWENCSE